MTSKYYIKVKIHDIDDFEKYSFRNNLKIDHLSNDIGINGGAMYSVNMDSDQALALSLIFPLMGCLNLHKNTTEPYINL